MDQMSRSLMPGTRISCLSQSISLQSVKNWQVTHHWNQEMVLTMKCRRNLWIIHRQEGASLLKTTLTARSQAEKDHSITTYNLPGKRFLTSSPPPCPKQWATLTRRSHEDPNLTARSRTIKHLLAFNQAVLDIKLPQHQHQHQNYIHPWAMHNQAITARLRSNQVFYLLFNVFPF